MPARSEAGICKARASTVVAASARKLRQEFLRSYALTSPPHDAILNHMVYIQNEQLDRAFSALADPTRRAILEQLARQDGQSVTELAQPFAVSLPAVMKHLDVLARANLIERAKSGRTVRCRLKAAPMESAMQWLARYERFWNDRLDRLAAFVEEEQCSPNQALPSKSRLKAQPAQVFSAWTDPEKIVHWFGPNETMAGSVRAEMDVRAGGRYRISFKTEDGEYHEVGGVYREVAPPSRLVFTWAWHSTPERELLVISDHGRGRRRHHAHAAPRAVLRRKARDGHQRGWTGTLEKLDQYLS